MAGHAEGCPSDPFHVDSCGGETVLSFMQTALNLHTDRRDLTFSENATEGLVRKVFLVVAHSAQSAIPPPVGAAAAEKIGRAVNTPSFGVTALTVFFAFVLSVCIFVSALGVFDAWPSLNWRERKLTEPPRTTNRMGVVFVRLLIITTVVAEGYDLGIVGGVIGPLAKDLRLTETQSAVFISVSGFLVAIGAPLGGYFADAVGRLRALGMAYALLIVGAIMLAYAQSFAVLLLGRTIQTFGVGGAMSITLTYATEVAPAGVRGQFPGMIELFLEVGMFFGYLMNANLVDVPGGWRWVFGIGGILPLVILPLIVLGIPPESPRYLAMSGKRTEAEAVLRTLVDDSEAEDTVEGWMHDRQVEAPPWAEVLCPKKPAERRAMRVCILVLLANQCCSVPTLGAYAPKMLSPALGDDIADVSMMLIILTRLIVLIPSLFLVDILGRRPILLASSAGVTLGTLFFSIESFANAGVLPWDVWAIEFTMINFAPGLGLVASVYASEVLGNSVRCKGVSIAMFLSRTSHGFVLLLFPFARDAIGDGGIFAIFTVANLGFFVFLARCAPETNRTPLEHIGKCFAD